MANKLRSLLTGLGIIFGVAAVIAMMAIGSGAQEEILEQIKLVGVNNIVITPIVEQEEKQLEATESDEGSENLDLARVQWQTSPTRQDGTTQRLRMYILPSKRSTVFLEFRQSLSERTDYSR